MDWRERLAELPVEQREALLGALTEHLPSWRWVRPGGGLAVWCELPSGSAVALALPSGDHGRHRPLVTTDRRVAGRSVGRAAAATTRLLVLPALTSKSTARDACCGG